ncbi:MAG: hypothetical protein ACYC4S_05085 [Rhodoferax sp.]
MQIPSSSPTQRPVAARRNSRLSAGARQRLRQSALLLSVSLSLLGLAAQAAQAPTLKIDDSSFRCIRQMQPVRHFFVDNLLGNHAGTLAAANAPKGAIYPPGSVVQLVPTEAMIKREPGFSPATGDWEFFELQVNAQGSKIDKRGFAEVNNRFGKNCFGCHAPAREPWDFICETGHGCEAIPIDHQMTGALQRSDPRCGAAQLQSGDTVALWKLRALVLVGSTVNWFKSIF